MDRVLELGRMEPGLLLVGQVLTGAAVIWEATPATDTACVYERIWEVSTVPLLRTFVGSGRSSSPWRGDEAEVVLRLPESYELVRRWALSQMPRCSVPGCWCPLAAA